MNTLLKSGSLALCASLGLLAQVQAIPITGALSFSGGVDLNAPAYVGTAATSFSTVKVDGVPSPSGTFGAFVSPGDPVTMAAPWVFTSAQAAIWSVGGFTFDLNAGSIVSQSGDDVSGVVSVLGTGTIKRIGYDPTPGTFAFGAQNGQQSFSFSASSQATPQRAPDGGFALGMLGFGLTFLGVAGRKIKP